MKKCNRSLPCRPVYKTSFSITEALYDSPAAKEPVLSRTLHGHLHIDLVRAACVSLVLLSAVAVVGLLADRR